MTGKKRNVGTVSLSLKYVVDLDNPRMVSQAQECVYNDLVQVLVKNAGLDEFYAMLDVKPDANLVAADIDDFLAECEEDLKE